MERAGPHGPARPSGWIAARRADDQECAVEVEVEVEVEVDVDVEVEVDVVVVCEQPGTLADFVVPPFRPASSRTWMRYELALGLVYEPRL